MNKLKSRLLALLAVFCLATANISGVVLAADIAASTTQSTEGAQATVTINKTTPAVNVVAQEAQATATYLLESSDFTDLSDTSKMYNASRNLILAIRSGVDASTYSKQYVEAAAKVVKEDGSLTVSVANYGYPNDVISSYAYLLIALPLTGNDATSFNGVNLVKAFDEKLSATTSKDFVFGTDYDTYENTGINPYHIGAVFSAIESYKASLSSYDTASANVITALEELTSLGTGIDYYGSNVDNNGIALPHFATAYATNSKVKTIVDTTLAYVEKTYADEKDGSSHSIFEIYNDDYTEVVGTDDSSNPDATALAIALYSQYGKAELAASNYNALIKLYKSSTTAGAYTYYGEDSLYSTQDALIGLVTYLRVLQNKSNPFNVSDVLTKEVVNATTNTATASVEDASKVLPSGTTITTDKLSSGADFEAVKKLATATVDTTKETATDLAVLEISLSNANAVEIHQLAGKVKVTLPLPVVVKEGQTLSVYRVDNDALTKLTSTVDGDNVTFETDHFSTYVFNVTEAIKVNEDPKVDEITKIDGYAKIDEGTKVDEGSKVVEEPKVDAGSKVVEDNKLSPKTADNSNLFVLVALLGLASLSLASLTFKKSR